MAKEKNKGKKAGSWSTAKLIIGIISIVLFAFIALQSCAAGVSNALQDNGATSGSSGLFCAICMLVAGIIDVASRKSEGKGACITAMCFYFVGALLTIGTGSTYGDLPIWGSVAFGFGLVNLGSILITTKKLSSKKNLVTIGVIVLSIIGLVVGIVSGSSSDSEEASGTKSHENKKSSSKQKEDKTTYGLNEKFVFDSLEITIGSEFEVVTVDNEYSDYYGAKALKIPVTIKNLKDETHHLNMFDYKFFGSKGTELETFDYYFDESVSEAGDLRTDASYTKYFYVEYDGNGKYAVEFDDWSKKLTVEFEVNI